MTQKLKQNNQSGFSKNTNFTTGTKLQEEIINHNLLKNNIIIRQHTPWEMNLNVSWCIIKSNLLISHVLATIPCKTAPSVGVGVERKTS